MIKGTLYLLVLAGIAVICVIGEIKYRIECKRLIQRGLNPEFFTTRYKTYPEAGIIIVGIVAFIAVILLMINTWNDPIE